MIAEQLKSIRTRLRLAMNGVISASMREKGVRYRLNFGVPLPEIRTIAAAYAPDAGLAAALWKEDIREFKILATFLQPPALFTHEEAIVWIKEISYPEIAEQASRNLFSKMEAPDQLAATLFDLSAQEAYPYLRCVAFLTLAHWQAAGHTLSATGRDQLREEALRTLAADSAEVSLAEEQAALLALRFYGRASETAATEVLDWLAQFAASDNPRQQEFYNELKFEFEYSR